MSIAETIRTADWKTEKHVPVIESPEHLAAGVATTIKVTVGAAVSHPNTTEHHIRWVELHFQPSGSQLTYELARVDFSAHGESAAGANQGPVSTVPTASVSVAMKQSGTLHALSYCNVHGLWASSMEITVE